MTLIDRYRFIVLYKTAFYSFYLPVALAFILFGISKSEIFEEAKGILLPLGEFFQIQDDYLDCYGHPDVIGKIGTDILDKKCTWILLKALEVASEEQKLRLQEIYGTKKGEDEVKLIYRSLKIEEIFFNHEDQVKGEIEQMIEKVDSQYKTVYLNFSKKIFGRKK